MGNIQGGYQKDGEELRKEGDTQDECEAKEPTKR
jgi:hypothetical protein